LLRLRLLPLVSVLRTSNLGPLIRAADVMYEAPIDSLQNAEQTETRRHTAVPLLSQTLAIQTKIDGWKDQHLNARVK
jgi:hypothetical protein